MTFHLDCPPEFAELSFDGIVAAVCIEGTCNLLCKGRSTAKGFTGKDTDNGTGKGLETEAVVAVENAVFTGKKGILHVLWKIPYGNDFTALITGKFSNEFSVDIKKPCWKSSFKVGEIFCIYGINCRCESFPKKCSKNNGKENEHAKTE